MKIQNLSIYIDLIPWLFFSDPKVFLKISKVVTPINYGLCSFSWCHSLFAQIRVPSFQIRLMIKSFTAFFVIVASFEGSLTQKITVKPERYCCGIPPIYKMPTFSDFRIDCPSKSKSGTSIPARNLKHISLAPAVLVSSFFLLIRFWLRNIFQTSIVCPASTPVLWIQTHFRFS